MPTDTVIITDVNWNKVKVEAVKGNNADPNANPSEGSQTLSRNGDWKIYSEGEDVWYRRDTNPDHPNGQMTPWTHRPCYGNGQTYQENI